LGTESRRWLNDMGEALAFDSLAALMTLAELITLIATCNRGAVAVQVGLRTAATDMHSGE